MEIAWLAILVAGGHANGRVHMQTVVDDNSDGGFR